jgi:hypothetical protein
VVQRADKRSSNKPKPSVRGYCSHLHDMPTAQGVRDAQVARAKLGKAQADLAHGLGRANSPASLSRHAGHAIPVVVGGALLHSSMVDRDGIAHFILDTAESAGLRPVHRLRVLAYIQRFKLHKKCEDGWLQQIAVGRTS